MKYLNIFNVSVGISIISIFILSCQKTEVKSVPPVTSYLVKVDSRQVIVKEYVIDSCQYIGDLHFDTRSRYLTHKGNCSNPKHFK